MDNFSFYILKPNKKVSLINSLSDFLANPNSFTIMFQRTFKNELFKFTYLDTEKEPEFIIKNIYDAYVAEFKNLIIVYTHHLPTVKLFQQYLKTFDIDTSIITFTENDLLNIIDKPKFKLLKMLNEVNEDWTMDEYLEVLKRYGLKEINLFFEDKTGFSLTMNSYGYIQLPFNIPYESVLNLIDNIIS